MAPPAGAAFFQGGVGTGTASTSVLATFQNGQTFIRWPDQDIGAAGNNWRYSVYRSTSVLNSGNCASATLIASSVFNNSAQLFGGNISVINGSTFTQANRQNAALPMSVLSDLGTPVNSYTGLQVYTALGSASAYYCVIAISQNGGSDTYIGAAGPVSESVGTPTPIKAADSLTRGQSYGKITAPTGLPIILNAHASSGTGGAPPNNIYGDYWEWFLTTTDGYQDGRYTATDVLQDNAQNWPGETHALVLSPRDTWWSTNGTTGLETYHQGVGMSPNALVGAANKMYVSTANGYQKMLNHAVSHYGADGNQIHWSGTSMGAWGGANTGVRMTSPQLSGVWVTLPRWRMDNYTSQTWAGLTWNAAWPFAPSLAAAPNLMGTNAAAINLNTGPVWGGTAGYVDIPTFMSSNLGTDIPYVSTMATKNDPFSLWADHLSALTALRAGKRGFAFVWTMGLHDGTGAAGAIDCDSSTRTTATCYHKANFKLNAAYLAFDNSSIDDDPGNGGTTANGLVNGDYVGCSNCGFSWTVSADTAGAFNFSVGNGYMANAATAAPATTLTGSMASSGSGSVTVTSGAAFSTIATGNYFLVGGTEVVLVASISGNTVNFTTRGLLGSTAAAHSPGAAIQQFIIKPTGPNAGAVSSMTVDIIPRRRQAFLPAVSATVTCTVTPNGGSPSTLTPTVDADGLFTLLSVPINSSGVTVVTCA